MRTVARYTTVGLALLSLAGCEKTGAFGDATSIIAGVSTALWEEIEDTVYTALEPPIFTVRPERTFEVTHQDPAGETWSLLREFKQMLVVGKASDTWIAEALAEVPGDATLDPPQILQGYNVWARGQTVTILLLSPNGGIEEVASQLPELHQLLDNQFRELALSRMYASGPDSALADTLRSEASFELMLPRVYYWAQQDSVFVFRNDNPDPSELIRQLSVTWRTPIPTGIETDAILDWRQSVATEYYTDDQIFDLTTVSSKTLEGRNRDTFEVRAVWANPPESGWPAGGPFITRAVVCPEQDRLYLLDAWLYAPGKEKYEYMIQLETILDSFRCEGTVG